jgi:hypothetical protein
VPIYFSLKKKKCVSKSLTESELVALLDNLGLVELFQELVEFMLIERLLKPIIFQDNTSVIMLVTKGGGVMRTKHLRVGMNLVLEAVRENRIEIKYVETEQMKVDGLMKALNGKVYKDFVEMCLKGT